MVDDVFIITYVFVELKCRFFLYYVNGLKTRNKSSSWFLYHIDAFRGCEQLSSVFELLSLSYKQLCL